MTESKTVVVDVLLALTDVYKEYLWSWPNLIRWFITVILVLGVYDVCFAPNAPVKDFSDGTAIAEVLVTVAMFIFLGLHVFPFLRLRAIVAKSPGYKQTRKFFFSPAGVRTESVDGTSDSKWSLFARITETKTLFLFWMTPAAATFVPKRCFASQEDVVALRTLIKENFHGKWRLRRE